MVDQCYWFSILEEEGKEINIFGWKDGDVFYVLVNMIKIVFFYYF